MGERERGRRRSKEHNNEDKQRKRSKFRHDEGGLSRSSHLFITCRLFALGLHF